jgi:predicted regulator of Ras-like GTPase activity (Roadblock/LC7/MglB family)
MRLLKTAYLLLFIAPLWLKAQHPVTFLTKSESDMVKKDILKYPLLNRSYKEIRAEVDQWVNKEIDVPVPKDPAGGYTHDKHKYNYMLLFNSGILYNLTGEQKYASLIATTLLKYAALNPTLKNHPQATSSSPGRIFWQALNDANWLVYCGMAYDLAYNGIKPADRKIIEEGAFKPEVEFITGDLQRWFDLIHNHGVWATAGVGLVGIASGNKDYVDKALYGTQKDGKSGFIALMDGLFSPDGFYAEGPYYTRYAILPYYLFATALDRVRPELKIFQYRDRILQKALIAGLQQTNLDGTFYSFNDALKEKDYTTNELVTAVSIAWDKYGKDDGLLVVAREQNRVLLNKGGAAIAAALSTGKYNTLRFPYKTVEYTDGSKGDRGGVSVLRTGKDEQLTSLIFKYTSHGLSHGHYDKLNIQLYNKGNEVLSDYGAVRFIGIEQKYGGRYLPETKGYAAQTIAHNTLVLDEKSHFGGVEETAEKFPAQKRFSSLTGPAMQVVSASTDKAYDGVQLQRTVYLLHLPGGKQLMTDIFTARSEAAHQYDLPFHYNGQLISTSVKYKPFTDKQETLGSKNGYQYLWKEAEAQVSDTLVQLTFLNERTYYTLSSLVQGPATVYFTRSGANDPSFNLRHEPAIIFRNNGQNRTYVNVLEIHGSFDPINEFSTGAYASVKKIRMIQQDEAYTITAITVDDKEIIIAQSNKETAANKTHRTAGYSWQGPAAVFYNGIQLK